MNPAHQPPGSPQHINVPTIAMPRLELPAGVTDAEVTAWDREQSQIAIVWTAGSALSSARAHLREARRLQRRANRRPSFGRAGRRQIQESLRSRDRLILAGVTCGIAELLRADLVPGAEQIARVRERCEQRHGESVPEYAISVENWIHDLAGESRLTRG